MAFTLNRRLAQLVDSNGQLNTGKIPNDYITSDHVADNTITSAMLHTSFTVSTSNLTSIDTDDVSEGSTNLYYTDARVGTYISGNRDYGNITTTGYIAGPATFTIDPAAVGDNTGTVVIAGNLQVDGTTTTINSTTVNVDDLNIQLATGAANAAAADGAGLTVDGANATINYNGTLDTWEFNKELRLTTGSFASHVNGNRYIKYRSTYDSAIVADFELKSDNNSAAVARITSTGIADVLQVFDNTTQVVTIADGGNVGIGTDQPNQLLHLDNSTNTTDSAGIRIISGTEGNARILFGDSGYGSRGRLIYSNSDDSLQFWGASSTTSEERMRIDSSGNVGIGGSPTNYSDHKTLSLYGNTGTGAGFIEFNDTSGNADAVVFSDNGNLFVNADYDNTTADSSIRFRVDGSSEKMRIDSSGNLIMTAGGTIRAGGVNDLILDAGESGTPDIYLQSGGATKVKIEGSNGQVMIGHTSSFAHGDADNLAIGDGSSNSGLTIYTGADKESSIIFGNNGTNGNLDAGIKYYHESHGTVANRRAMTFATGGSMAERMRIDSSGKVGIGTNSPLNKLHVDGDVHIGDGEDYSSYAKLAVYGNVYQGDVALLIKNDRYNDSTATASLIFEHRTHAGQGHAAKIICRRQSGYNESAGSKDAALDFYTANGGTLSHQMQIDRDGRVGIGTGTSSISYPFIVQSGTTDQQFRLTNASSSISTMHAGFGCNPASDITIQAQGNGVQWRFGSNVSNGNAYWINQNNVGVNFASGSNAWSAHSDERLKENITDIGSVLDVIQDYRCVKFNFKSSPDKEIIGFIAQDWETDFPEVVDEDDAFTIQDDGSLVEANKEGNVSTTKVKSIAYTETIPVLLKAIQELSTKLEAAEARITELEG